VAGESELVSAAIAYSFVRAKSLSASSSALASASRGAISIVRENPFQPNSSSRRRNGLNAEPIGLILPSSYFRRFRPMASTEKLTTTVSTKGQIILPKAIRLKWEWDAGTRLTVEETPDGALLKPAPAFVETRPQDVFGLLPYSGGKPKSIKGMDAGVLAEAKRRNARD